MTSTARPWPWLGSVLLHALIVGLLLWGGFQTTTPSAPAPAMLELWTTAPAPPPSAPSLPEAAPTPRPTSPEAPPAEVNLGQKKNPAVEPTPPTKLEKPSTIETPKTPTKPAVESKVNEPVTKKTDKQVNTKPASQTPSKPAKAYNPDADDLLASLDSTKTSGKANARQDQAGSKQGQAGGVAGGTGVNEAWVNQVRAKVRPLVSIPASLTGNPRVQLSVTLLPTLEVRAVQLLQSSGNSAYDDAVTRAVWEAKRMPSLPAGVTFNNDYRVFTLTFRPY